MAKRFADRDRVSNLHDDVGHVTWVITNSSQMSLGWKPARIEVSLEQSGST